MTATSPCTRIIISLSSESVTFDRLAVTFAPLLCPLGLSLHLAAVVDRDALRPIHARVNLLGWVGLALAACVFRLWSDVANSRLALAFFWGDNLTLPVVLVTLGLFLYGHVVVLPVLAVTQFGLFASACLFVASLFRTSRVPVEHRAARVGTALGRVPS